MIVVDKASGQEYDFPDDASQDQIRAYMMKVSPPKQAQAPQSFAQRALAERQTPAQTGGVGYGLSQGLSAAAGLPGDIARLGGAGLEWLGSKVAPQTTQSVADWARNNITLPPGSAQVMAANPPPMAPPTTPLGKFAAGVSQYIPGGMMGGLPGAISGLGAGLGAQGAQSMGAPPWAQLLAGTAGGLAPSAVGGLAGLFRSPLTKQTTQAFQDLEKTSPGAAAAGQQMMGEAQKRGIDLTAGEAFAPKVGQGQVAELQARSMQNREDALRYAEAIQKRPQQVKNAVAEQLAALGPDVPIDDLVNGTSQIAQKAIDDANTFRTAQTRDLYARADPLQVPQDQVARVLDTIDTQLERVSPGTPAYTGLSDLRNMLIREGAPDTQISRLNSAYQSIRDRMNYDVDAAGSLKRETGTVGPINKQLEQILESASPDFAEAQRRYRELSGPIEQMQNGFVGKMSRGTTPQALQSIMFDPRYSIDRVPEIAQLFRSQGKLDLLGSWLNKTLNNSFSDAQKTLAGGSENPEMGALWARKIYGNPNQRNLLQAYAGEMDPSGSLGRSFDMTMKILESTGRIPGLGMTIPAEQTGGGAGARIAGKAAVAAGMAMTGHPMGQAGAGYMMANEIGRQLSRKVDTATPAGVAKMFSDPKNIPKFMALARSDPRSPRALSLVLSMMGGRSDPATGEELGAVP